MESIKYSENKAVLKVNEKIYGKGVMEKAAKDFSELCAVSIKEGSIEITPLPSGANIDLRILSCEFFNYMLALIKNE